MDVDDLFRREARRNRLAVGGALALIWVTIMAVTGGPGGAPTATATTSGPVYVIGDATTQPLLDALAKALPTRLTTGTPTATTFAAPGCAPSPTPYDTGARVAALLGSAYVTPAGTYGDPVPAGCRPDAVALADPWPSLPLDAPPKAGVPVGTALTSYTGPDVITQANTVIRNADVPFGLTVQAAGVVIQGSRIHGTGSYGVFSGAPGLTIMDSTIVGFDNAVGGDGYTAQGVEVTGQNDDGFKLGTDVTVLDSYCHDLLVGPESHSDCAQLQGGDTNVVVRGNWFHPGRNSPNSAIFIANDLGPGSGGPVLVEGNWLGGGNFTVFCLQAPFGLTGVTIRDNRFLLDAQYGPTAITCPASISGNVSMVGESAVN
jgi:hypothetical protein